MMRRFSSRVVRSTSVTCSGQVFPTTVHTGVPASSSARMLASSSGPAPARQVEPKAARSARFQGRSRARAKNSASLGFEPGQPPSMKAIPSSSRRRAMRSLSSTEREIPSRWVPSRRVVSYS